ncbi:FLJ37770-like protein [Acromyrmex echinatior]|uniref:FLJ37770-like protein n=1 Tax=Acromyrmex echinatior TaxID=103372 RepID=F4WE01_ACREC|nr:FLJ37770-like protein [Acromyrmex echinatior]
MLENCFGSDILKKTTVYEWHERFRSGRESVEDNERSSRPSTSKTDENIDKVREMMANNRKLTIRKLAEDLNIAYGSVQDIVVNDLGLRRVAANAIIIREFLVKNKTNTIQQPSNSPDMAPCDFFLFDRVKKPLRGTRFNSRKEVMEKSKTALMAIPIIEFQKCFESWIKRWHKCVAVAGEYFEGDNITFDE